MTGIEVALAALGILGTVVGALVWLLKGLFTQNQTVLSELTSAIKSLKDTLSKTDEETRKFQVLVVKKLDNLDKKADRNHQATVQIREQKVLHQTVINQEQEDAQ